jgi:hypothetical protein
MMIRFRGFPSVTRCSVAVGIGGGVVRPVTYGLQPGRFYHTLGEKSKFNSGHQQKQSGKKNGGSNHGDEWRQTVQR